MSAALILPFERRIMEGQDKEEYKARCDFKRLMRKVLSGNEYLVYEVLCDAASEGNEGWCWPSYERLAEWCGYISDRTLTKSITRLEEMGLVEIKRPPRCPGNQEPSQYKPLKNPTVETMLALTQQWEAKKQEHEQAGDDSTAKNTVRTQYRKKYGDSTVIFSPIVPQKIRSNDTNLNDTNITNIKAETNVSGPTSGPRQPEKRLIDFLTEEYEKAKSGQGETGNSSQDTMGLVGIAFETTFRAPPDYARLGRMAAKIGGKWALIELILSLTNRPVKDDPHDYLQGAVERKKGERNGYSNGNGTTNGRAAMAGNGARTQGTGYVNAKGRQSRPGNSDVTDYSTWD